MQCDVDDAVRKKAKSPHELFMLNLAAFHLLATPAGIALEIGLWAFLIPLILSVMVMLITWRRAKYCELYCPWFVMLHWKLALRRYRFLLIAYGATALILGLGWLLTMGEQHSTQHIMRTVFTRLSIVPTLLMVMVGFIMESGAIVQASAGQVPDRIATLYPTTEERQSDASSA